MDRDDGDGRSRRAPVRAESVAVGRARRRRRPLPRAQVRLSRHLLLGGRPRAGWVGGARDHEPRALPRRHRRPLACRQGGTRRSCPSTTRSSSTRLTGSRTQPPTGSAAGCRSPASVGLPATSSEPPENGASRRPLACSTRSRRSEQTVLGSLEAPRGRRRLGPDDVDGALDGVAALAAALARLEETLQGSGEEADALGRRALGAALDLETCFELDPDRVSWAEAGRGLVGARRRRRRSARRALGHGT